MIENNMNNLNAVERVLRLIVGCGLISTVMFASMPLDYLILMPLVGIYPCLTAIVGWDPLYFVFGVKQSKLEHFLKDHLAHNRHSNLLRPRAI